jgi:hypothetical protein
MSESANWEGDLVTQSDKVNIAIGVFFIILLAVTAYAVTRPPRDHD